MGIWWHDGPGATVGNWSCYLGFSAGIFWVRNADKCLMLLAPWDRPRFSERNGYWRHWRFMGWRIGWSD